MGTSKRFTTAVSVFAVVIALGALSIVFMDRLLAFSINRFTPYRISYEKWGSPFDRRSIEGLELYIPDEHLDIKAEKAFVTADIRSLLAGKLLMSFDLKKTHLILKGQAGGGAPGAQKDLSVFIFDPGQVYDRIVFTFYDDGKKLEVRDFKAVSENVVILCDCTLDREKENIDLKLKVSFSPAMYETMPKDIREQLLSPDDNGWYASVIDYKGNIAFLRALYSLL